MGKIDFDDRLHRTYQKGRALLPETQALWMEVAGRYLGEARELTILDLGCGTGRFSPLLAEAFGSDVVGVEPADKMRAVAAAGELGDRQTQHGAAQIGSDDARCTALPEQLAGHVAGAAGEIENHGIGGKAV